MLCGRRKIIGLLAFCAIAVIVYAGWLGAAHTPTHRLVNSSDGAFQQFVKHFKSQDWLILATNGTRVNRLAPDGVFPEAFRLPLACHCFGGPDKDGRFFAVHDQYLGREIEVPGLPHKAHSSRTDIYLIGLRGDITNTLSVKGLNRGVSDVRYTGTTREAMILSGVYEHVLRRNREESYEYVCVYDSYFLDPFTGVLNPTSLRKIRELGEIHPDGLQYLFVDADGFVCILDRSDNSVHQVCEGSRPIWDARGTGVRFIKGYRFFQCRGTASISAVTGDIGMEYHRDLATGKEIPLGEAGDCFVWSPDRMYGIRFFFYDKLTAYNRARVIYETADGATRWLVNPDIAAPVSVIWATNPERNNRKNANSPIIPEEKGHKSND